jgi:hypothetical protein
LALGSTKYEPSGTYGVLQKVSESVEKGIPFQFFKSV